VRTARHHGAATLEFNLEPSGGSMYFAETRIGAAATLVPRWVDEMLASRQRG
jgi:NAD-dependent deacetylase